jgi:hypothetical protein
MRGSFDQQFEGHQKKICASEEIGGARPSVEDIARRKMRQATANALARKPGESENDYIQRLNAKLAAEVAE